MLGAFCAQDLALFVLFFDLMLVPFYFLVGQWGGPDRVAAAIKMVIYTLVGSLLMLAGAVATAVLAAAGPAAAISFVLSDLAANPLPESTQKWIFITFALAFLIKMPAFPFQGWMPDAYRAMPLPALAFFSRRRLEGGRLRLPAAGAAAVPGGDRGLARDPADPRGDLDPVRVGAGVHADQRAVDPGLLVGRAARVHHARDLRVGHRRRRARRARCCRRSTTASWSRRCSS